MVKENVSKGDLPSDEENLPQVSEPIIYENLKFQLETNKRLYKYGEPIEVRYSVKNLDNVTKEIVDSYTFTYYIYDKKNEIVYSPPGLEAFKKIVIEPMETYIEMGTWDQKTNEGQQVPPGDYRIEKWKLSVNITIAYQEVENVD